MKRILIYFGLTMTLLYSVGCQEKAGQATYFSTPQEAASKAKNDLLAVLRSRNDIALGFEQQTIEKSQPAAPMLQYQITFEDLAAADSFNTLRRNALAAVVPLVADGTVATVVGVAKSDAGWKVASLADKSLASEVDVVRKAVGPQAQIVIYDLPHSGEKVYGAMQPATRGAGTVYQLHGFQFTGACAGRAPAAGAEAGCGRVPAEIRRRTQASEGSALNNRCQRVGSVAGAS